MFNDLNSGDNYQKALASFLKGYASKTCGVCSGIGHHAGECPIIRKLNRAVASNPILKKVWGNYKASKRTGGKQNLIAKQGKTSLENLMQESNTSIVKKVFR